MRRVDLALACVLDLAIGDPPWSPHPVRLFGAVIARAERVRDADASPRRQLIEGAVLTTLLAAAAYGVGRNVARRSRAAGIIAAASTLAARDLDTAVARVQAALECEDIAAARAALSQVVGRDVERLDARGIAAAALETLAESFADGVVAPLFWLRVAGVGGATAFKAISTLDSMIGHRELPHTYFGRVAARADDVANYIPARIAAAAIVAAARSPRAAAVARRDAAAHASPNGGWPEAALAGALGVRLGGDAWYDGVLASRAVLGAEFTPPYVADIARGRALLRRAAAIAAAVAIASAAP